MEDPNGSVSHSERKPLSHVVSDCVERWFHDTLKQARAGDPAMMVLVAQMFHNGYGVTKNEQKVWRSCGRPLLCRTEIGDFISVICLPTR
jgi:hypothetical protein